MIISCSMQSFVPIHRLHEKLWRGKRSGMRPYFLAFKKICLKTYGIIQACSTSPPSGYQVDGLPLVAHGQIASQSIQNYSRAFLATPRHHLSAPESFLGTSIFHDFPWFSKMIKCVNGPRPLAKKSRKASERAPKTMGTQIKNDPYDELWPEISWAKGPPGYQTGAPLGNLAAPCHLKESASHQITFLRNRQEAS